MSSKEASVRARQLRIRESIQAVMSEEADMVLILLGDRYLKAADFGSIAFTNTPAWAISGKVSLGELPKFINPILIKHADTTRYRAGMLALKGAVAQTSVAHPGQKNGAEESTVYVLRSTDKYLLLLGVDGTTLQSYGDSGHAMVESEGRPISSLAKKCPAVVAA